MLNESIPLYTKIWYLRFRRICFSLQQAYRKQQAQIQEKLKDCVEKQSLKSLERLSNLFQPNSDNNEPTVMETSLGVDALETTAAPVSLKGENKAPIKKSKKRKHSLKAKKGSTEKQQKSNEKRRPKLFVQF